MTEEQATYLNRPFGFVLLRDWPYTHPNGSMGILKAGTILNRIPNGSGYYSGPTGLYLTYIIAVDNPEWFKPTE